MEVGSRHVNGTALDHVNFFFFRIQHENGCYFAVVRDGRAQI